MKSHNKQIFASILLFSISFVSVAQEAPPPPMPPPPPGLPIDSFVVFGLVLGIIYGAYKYTKLTKKSR